MVASLDLRLSASFASSEKTYSTQTTAGVPGRTASGPTWLPVSTNLCLTLHKRTRSLGTRETRKGRGRSAAERQVDAPLSRGPFFRRGDTSPRSISRSSISIRVAAVRSVESGRVTLVVRRENIIERHPRERSIVAAATNGHRGLPRRSQWLSSVERAGALMPSAV